MSFRPSFLKSTPQAFSFSGATIAVPATQLITAVDLTAAIILHAGTRGQEGGGFVHGANHNYLDFSDSTHVRATTLANPSATTVINDGVVLEFFRSSLHQDVYWNKVGLSSIQPTNTLATGLSLGAKAFLVAAGLASDYTVAASLNEGTQLITLELNVGTGVVTIDRRGVSGCAIQGAFFIVDPR